MRRRLEQAAKHPSHSVWRADGANEELSASVNLLFQAELAPRVLAGSHKDSQDSYKDILVALGWRQTDSHPLLQMSIRLQGEQLCSGRRAALLGSRLVDPSRLGRQQCRRSRDLLWRILHCSECLLLAASQRSPLDNIPTLGHSCDWM